MKGFEDGVIYNDLTVDHQNLFTLTKDTLMMQLPGIRDHKNIKFQFQPIRSHDQFQPIKTFSQFSQSDRKQTSKGKSLYVVRHAAALGEQSGKETKLRTSAVSWHRNMTTRTSLRNSHL